MAYYGGALQCIKTILENSSKSHFYKPIIPLMINTADMSYHLFVTQIVKRYFLST